MTNFFTDGLAPQDNNELAPGLDTTLLNQSVQQGDGNSPVPETGTQALIPRGTPVPPIPQGSGNGPGPSGFSTGARTNRNAFPQGPSAPVAGTMRPPGSWVGTGQYSPPPGPPPGSGVAPTSPGYAPASGYFVLTTLDPSMPNGSLPVLAWRGTTAPANTNIPWIDTSVTIPAFKYYADSTNGWIALPGSTGPIGPTGPTGPAGADGADGHSPLYRGVWDNTTAYAVLDWVTRGGSSYISLVANTGQDPTAASSIYWGIIAQGFVYRGAWSNTAAYVPYDIVTHDAASYIAIADSTGVTPGTDASIWQAIFSVPVFGASGSGHAAGLVPDPGSTAGATHYLREDGTWSVPTGTVTSVGLSMPATFSVASSPVTGAGTLTVTWNTQTAAYVLAGPASGGAAAPTFRLLTGTDLPVFVASGSTHAPGAVPDPGATAGTTRFLREDATWAAPPSTTYAVFGAAGSGHSTGLVPDPGATSGLDKRLGDDGTWHKALKRHIQVFFEAPSTAFAGSADLSQVYLFPTGQGGNSVTWVPISMTLYCSGVASGPKTSSVQLQMNSGPGSSGSPSTLTNSLSLTASAQASASTTTFPSGVTVSSGMFAYPVWTNDINMSNVWVEIEFEAQDTNN